MKYWNLGISESQNHGLHIQNQAVIILAQGHGIFRCSKFPRIFLVLLDGCCVPQVAPSRSAPMSSFWHNTCGWGGIQARGPKAFGTLVYHIRGASSTRRKFARASFRARSSSVGRACCSSVCLCPTNCTPHRPRTVNNQWRCKAKAGARGRRLTTPWLFVQSGSGQAGQHEVSACKKQ
jgi:hypothetical protein